MISIALKDKSKNFFWNLKEHQITYNRNLSQNSQVDWSIYDPDFFTINGNSFPRVLNDTLATIKGNVGDTIKIFIANTGQSSHALHFHGFHAEILQSSNDQAQVGWSKDSFPLKSMETMLLLMVPDKKGEYSVHDHNLIATSATLMHPFGMVIMMTIE